MPLRLFDNHESVLHVTLGQGESALDAYKALRRNAGKTAPAKHIAIVNSTLPFSSGAIDVPCMKPTAAHCVAASPVDELSVGEQHMSVVQTFQDMANFYLRQGDYPEALEYYQNVTSGLLCRSSSAAARALQARR